MSETERMPAKEFEDQLTLANKLMSDARGILHAGFGVSRNGRNGENIDRVYLRAASLLASAGVDMLLDLDDVLTDPACGEFQPKKEGERDG